MPAMYGLEEFEQKYIMRLCYDFAEEHSYDTPVIVFAAGEIRIKFFNSPIYTSFDVIYEYNMDENFNFSDFMFYILIKFELRGKED